MVEHNRVSSLTPGNRIINDTIVYKDNAREIKVHRIFIFLATSHSL